MKKQVQDLTTELEESKRAFNDLTGAKSKLQSDNTNLVIQLEEAEASIASVNKTKQQLQSQLDAAKRDAEDELRAKKKLQSRLADAEDQLSRR